VGEEGEGVDMRAIVSAALALFLVPALSYANTSQSVSDLGVTTHLVMAGAHSSWAVGAVLGLLLFSWFAGVARGTPLPTLEATALGAYVGGMRYFLADYSLTIQMVFVTIFLVWLASFIIMVIRVASPWGRHSLLELYDLLFARPWRRAK
jgi:hypothetical protein